MLITWYGRWLTVVVGRDLCRCLDVFVLIGIGPRTDHGPHTLCSWPLFVEASWNWLPTIFTAPAEAWLHYVHGPAYANSVLWTGRDRRIVQWSWPFVARWGIRR